MFDNPGGLRPPAADAHDTNSSLSCCCLIFLFSFVTESSCRMHYKKDKLR